MRTRSTSIEAGFTLIELLVAMSIFSFMLLIVVSGFINIVHIRSQALAANVAEDNARTAMDEVVRAVRTSNDILPSAPGTLCLTSTTTGQQTIYYTEPVGLGGVLYRATSPTCIVPGSSRQAITSDTVSVMNFSAPLSTVGTIKRQVSLTLTVVSNNSTAQGAICGPTKADRNFCSSITLNSGAVPR